MDHTCQPGRAAVTLCVMGLVLADSAFAQVASGTSARLGTSDCCTPHAGGGCDDPVCSATVIDADFDCFFAWDSICVAEAENLCGSLCSGGGCPGEGDCCTAHGSPGCSEALCCDMVCTENSACCSSQWTDVCADLAVAICDVCEPPIVCPMEGDCCAPNLTPGCDRKGCCELICIELNPPDEYCCRGEWDDVCVRKARENCPNICICVKFGDMDGNDFWNLRDVAGFQNCFSSSGAAIDDSCACGDYDADDDADLADYAVLQGLLTSP